MKKTTKLGLLILTFSLLILTVLFPDSDMLLLAHTGNSLVVMTMSFYALVDEKPDHYFARICMASTILFGFFVLTDIAFHRPFVSSYLLLTLSRSAHLLGEEVAFLDQYVHRFNEIFSIFLNDSHHEKEKNSSNS
jgi:hypothetical protein